MTKLIIQIPCYNEAETLGITLDALPRALDGIDQVEWLVVNDGSTDRTVEVAHAHGVDHIVDLPTNKGLAQAFMAGLLRCLEEGADIIVNTDADNQYNAEDIPKLIQPILERRAEIVIGARPIDTMEHFSPTKKLLQRLGSWTVRKLSQTDIADAPCGFRAISREAAFRLNVFNDYTYTLETIIQAGLHNIPVCSVPVRTNGPLRPSRLIKSIPDYLRRSIMTMATIVMVYRPAQSFFVLGSLPFGIGFLLGVRWLVLFFEGTDRAHVPSLILAAILLLSGFLLWLMGLIGQLLSINRRLLEDAQLTARKAALEAGRRPQDMRAQDKRAQNKQRKRA